MNQSLKSVWFESVDEIRKHDPEAIASHEETRSVLLKNVNLMRVIDHLDESYRSRFTLTVLREGTASEICPVSKLNSSRTARILNAWKNGIPLMPAIVCFKNGKLFIVDGNHRLNAAFCLGEETVPLEIFEPWGMEWLTLTDELDFYR